MIEKTLTELYQKHTGKVSDKWSSYLACYERLFAEYKQVPLSLFEIGVQNGGSLEIWSEYFREAEKLIGCDINPDCSRLKYDDSRVAVIVGDANCDATRAEVLKIESEFDLIIDDGSHQSGDIVKSFALYFPQLKNGGLFVIEDLHCSYWSSYSGGLSHPLSSIAFFKKLADIINYESWGVCITRRTYLEQFFVAYAIDIDENILSQIHSIEFINSICIIRKKAGNENLLGGRIITGKIEDVMSIDVLSGSRLDVPDQEGNEWSDMKWLKYENHLKLIDTIQDRDEEISVLNTKLTRKDEELQTSKQQELLLQNEMLLLQDEMLLLQNEVDAVYSSNSWKITSPIRLLGKLLRKHFR